MMRPESDRFVVIDPEDVGQVERLSTSYVFAHGEGMVPIDALRYALREFASPKPEEPKGLGAVVEDAGHRQFVRVCDCGCVGWRANRATTNANFVPWTDIAAIRVLAEGVTS